MAENTFQSDEMQSMMSDAIKRARQMYRRSSNFSGNFSEKHKSPEAENKVHEKDDGAEETFSLYKFAKMLGIDDDRLILFIIAIILAQEKDSLSTVLALLYIAM